MMKRKIILLLMIVIISCKISEKEVHLPFDERFIDLVAQKLDFPPYDNNPFFVRGENSKIIRLDPQELEEIYNENYSNMNYKEFVRKALNQQLQFNVKRKGTVFDLDSIITETYSSNNFFDFLKIYCDSVAPEKYILKNVPDKSIIEENSIFYYAFINNYLTVFDDYLGRYYIYDISLYFNEKK